MPRLHPVVDHLACPRPLPKLVLVPLLSPSFSLMFCRQVRVLPIFSAAHSALR